MGKLRDFVVKHTEGFNIQSGIRKNPAAVDVGFALVMPRFPPEQDRGLREEFEQLISERRIQALTELDAPITDPLNGDQYTFEHLREWVSEGDGDQNTQEDAALRFMALAYHFRMARVMVPPADWDEDMRMSVMKQGGVCIQAPWEPK